jgi:choline monooxygenase
MRVVEAIPSSWYTDAEILRAEQARVFAPHWHYIGSAGAVAENGSFLAADLGGLPIVVTRDAAGVLRALANVCRHRGSVIVEGCGRRQTIQCRYHGWTYRLDGTLHASPGAEVPPDGGRLPVLSVATAGPLLFASAVAGAPPLPEVLEPFTTLVRDVSRLDLDALELRRSVRHVIDANWKVVAENFMECYHCPLVHAETLPGYGGDDYIVTEHAALVTHRLDRDRFSWASLFPNTQISVFGDHGALIARQLVPDGPDRTVATLDYWFAPETPAGEAEASIDWFERIVAEDLPLCASVQRGITSGLLDRGYLHPFEERGPHHFQQLIADALRES